MSSARASLGVPGPRGAKGYQGPQGPQGYPGVQGFQGYTGPQGDVVDELNDFQDVDITNPQDGETLIYGTGTNSFTNSFLLHTSIDFSTVTEFTGATAAFFALGPKQFYLLEGDDCLRVTASTGAIPA